MGVGGWGDGYRLWVHIPSLVAQITCSGYPFSKGKPSPLLVDLPTLTASQTWVSLSPLAIFHLP